MPDSTAPTVSSDLNKHLADSIDKVITYEPIYYGRPILEEQLSQNGSDSAAQEPPLPHEELIINHDQPDTRLLADEAVSSDH